MQDNCNLVLHSLKRSLSVDRDKITIPNVHGKALIFPGNPPQRNSDRGEVQELIEVGFDPSYIRCLEEKEDIADNLSDYYIDDVFILFEKAIDFLNKTRSTFSYVHLDFCQHLKENEIETIDSLQGKMDSISRIRTSVSTNRGKSKQIDKEHIIRTKIMIPFVEMCFDSFNLDWDLIRSKLNESNRSSHIIGFIYLINHYFDMSLEDMINWIDTCKSNQESKLPPHNGQFNLSNLTQFTYHQNGTTMETIWVDLNPYNYSSISSDDLIYLDLYKYFYSLVSPIKVFAFLPKKG